jgi:uncharacterized protein
VRKQENDMPDMKSEELAHKLDLLIAAVERLSPVKAAMPEFSASDCFIWSAENLALQPVKKVNRVDLSLIRGVDHVRDILFENTRRFAQGLASNNVLLWGARGMGKSSLVKAVHHAIAKTQTNTATPLKLIEIHREDIDSLPKLMTLLRDASFNFILFCDDLSFDHDDTSYKSLKAALEGGVEGRPQNVVLYATSNRRHLLPRDMIENERSTSINPSEAVEEKVSLSDRFGLWLGFHKCSQDDYLEMVDAYALYHKMTVDRESLHHEALEWATTRGSRSGRVAFQFIQDLAGRQNVQLK